MKSWCAKKVCTRRVVGCHCDGRRDARICRCGHKCASHGSFVTNGIFVGIGEGICGWEMCRCTKFRNGRLDIVLGRELTAGTIFKHSEGAIKRWLQVRTAGPVSHAVKGHSGTPMVRLTAEDKAGTQHRVKVLADEDYETTSEFPRARNKKQETPKAEFSHTEDFGSVEAHPEAPENGKVPADAG